MKRVHVSLYILLLPDYVMQAQQKSIISGNPVLPGRYTDPEGAIFNSNYWIYPTYSAPYVKQVIFDAFSSPDLVNWTNHNRITDTSEIKWARRPMWAPAIVENDGNIICFLVQMIFKR